MMNIPGPSNFFHGSGNYYGGNGLRHNKMRQMLRHYKIRNGIDPRNDLPLHHYKYLFDEGATGRGGFLPLAALIPLIGEAVSFLGPALASGAAGAVGSLAVNKIAGRGLSATTLIPSRKTRLWLPNNIVQYHAPTDSWLAGRGIGDFFRNLAGRVGGLLNNKHVKKIGSAARDSLVKSTVNALEEIVQPNDDETKVIRRTRKRTAIPDILPPVAKAARRTKISTPTTKARKRVQKAIVNEVVEQIPGTDIPTTATAIQAARQAIRNPYEEMLLQGTGYH